MRALLKILTLTVFLGTLPVQSQEIRVEKFERIIPEMKNLKVLADIRIPPSQSRSPLVIVLPTAGGIDGTGAQYIQALNARGIATAELNPLMDEAWERNLMMSKVIMAHSVRNLDIDPDRIGILGFSHGGMVSLIGRSASLMDRLVPNVRARFRAHAALYPVCSLVYDANREPFMNWRSLRPMKSGEPNFYHRMFENSTKGKVLLLAAQDEDYEDAPVVCPKLVEDLNASVPGSAELVIYPHAGHGWDTLKSRTYEHHISRKSQQIRHYRSEATYEKSLTAVTDFFVRELAPR